MASACRVTARVWATSVISEGRVAGFLGTSWSDFQGDSANTSCQMVATLRRSVSSLISASSGKVARTSSTVMLGALSSAMLDRPPLDVVQLVEADHVFDVLAGGPHFLAVQAGLAGPGQLGEGRTERPGGHVGGRDGVGGHLPAPLFEQ